MKNKKVVIIEKSTELFLSYGVQHITMDDIANKCGISKKTIYKYFENKNDLLLYVVEIQEHKIKNTLKGFPEKYLNAIISLNMFFEFINSLFNSASPFIIKELKKYYPTIYIQLLKIKKAVILPFISENIKQGKRENLYKEKLNEYELSKSYDTILNIIFINYLSTNSNLDQQQAIGFLNHLFLHRLVSLKGLEILNLEHQIN